MAAALLDRAVVCGHHRDWVGARRWVTYAAELHSPLLHGLVHGLARINDRVLFLDRARGMAKYLRREADTWRSMMHEDSPRHVRGFFWGLRGLASLLPGSKEKTTPGGCPPVLPLKSAEVPESPNQQRRRLPLMPRSINTPLPNNHTLAGSGTGTGVPTSPE